MIYWGDTKITPEQFKEIRLQIAAGEKLEAIKRIRLWTMLSLADAVHIADYFYTIDFRHPQALIHVNKNSYTFAGNAKNANQKKVQNAAKTAGKGVGLAALFSGYGIFRIISGLVKPYMSKRK